MATSYIPINTAQRLGGQLRTAVEQVRAGLDGLDKLRGIMGTQTDGADYTLMEEQFGIGTGQGKAAAYQVGAFLDVLLTNDPVDKVKDKLAQLLNQFG